jgi:hypothetical protein
LGNSGIFWSGWRVFGAKDRAVMEFGKSSRIFVDYWRF